MTQDPPVTSGDGPAEEAQVVKWGGPPSREGRALPRLLGRLGRDRRLVPIVAGVGGVALFGSLISEWQITTINPQVFGDEGQGSQPLPAGVGELGSWGGGYLVGLLVLVAAMVLLVFGPRVARTYARLIALSIGGVLLAVLLALASTLSSTSLAISQAFTVGADADQFTLERGRGIYCALAGVVAVLIAAYLAGRLLPTPALRPDGATPNAADADPDDDDRPWRRPGTADDDARPGARPDAPLDLIVGPAPPFTSRPEDRDNAR